MSSCGVDEATEAEGRHFFRRVHELGTLVEEGKVYVVGEVLLMFGCRKYASDCWLVIEETCFFVRLGVGKVGG